MTIYLGVTGTLLSGKGTFAQAAAKHCDSILLSTSDELRIATAELGLSTERENLHRVANELRAKHGAGYLALRCVEKLRESGKTPEAVIFNDLRTAGEIDALRGEFGRGFYLVGIDASQSVRYARAKQRQRAGEHTRSFEEWRSLDLRENVPPTGDSTVQNVGACMARADFILYNESTVESFERQVASLVSSLARRDSAHDVVLGFSGLNGAGKTTFCTLAQEEYGALLLSLSDEIRREIVLRGEEITLPRLIDLGNQLRTEHGAGVLAERTARRIVKLGKGVYAIDSIFNPGEVDSLRKTLPNFRLFHVEAPLEARYGRLVARQRAGEHKISFEEFSKLDAGQAQGAVQNGQNLQACKAMADHVIVNGGTLEEFKVKCRAALGKEGL